MIIPTYYLNAEPVIEGVGEIDYVDTVAVAEEEARVAAAAEEAAAWGEALEVARTADAAEAREAALVAREEGEEEGVEELELVEEAEELAEEADAIDEDDGERTEYMNKLNRKAMEMNQLFIDGVVVHNGDDDNGDDGVELQTILQGILQGLADIDSDQYSLRGDPQTQRNSYFEDMDYTDDVDHIIHKFRGLDISRPSGWSQDKFLLVRLRKYILLHLETELDTDARALFQRINISIRAEDGNIEAPEQEETEPEVSPLPASIAETFNLGSEISIAPDPEDPEDSEGTRLQEIIYGLEDQMSDEYNRSGHNYDFILQNMTTVEKQNDNIGLLVELLSRNDSDFNLVLRVIQAKLNLEEHEGNATGREVMERFLQIATTARVRFAEEKAAKKAAERAAAANTEITFSGGKKYKSKKKQRKSNTKSKKKMPKNKKLFESRIIKILNKDYKEKLIDETIYKMLVKSDTNKATSVLKKFLSEYWGVLTDSEIAADIISQTLWLQQLIREQKSKKKAKKAKKNTKKKAKKNTKKAKKSKKRKN